MEQAAHAGRVAWQGYGKLLGMFGKPNGTDCLWCAGESGKAARAMTWAKAEALTTDLAIVPMTAIRAYVLWLIGKNE